MENVTLTKENVKKAYKNASKEQKRFLADLVKDQVNLSENILDRVKTVEDAFIEVGEDYGAFLKKCAINEDRPDEIARKELERVAKAINEGWEANVRDPNQKKWYCWFQFAKAGFAFADAAYGWTDAGAGRRLPPLSRNRRKISLYGNAIFI